MPIRGEIILSRTDSAWESQHVQEPCILPNPKDPRRLVMFYSGVPATNRNLCFIGKARALKSDPFTWRQVWKIGGTYVLTIEVGISAGKRWRPIIAVSHHPAAGWAQVDVDAPLQTRCEGRYRDETICHAATPAWSSPPNWIFEFQGLAPIVGSVRL
jgi:hypothetical protein